MERTKRTGALWAVCGCALMTPIAGCTARDQLSDSTRIDNGAVTEPVGTPPSVAKRVTTPAARPQGKEIVTKPKSPPASPSPAPPGQMIKPSPWQPPAVVDPVRPEVGNETPG